MRINFETGTLAYIMLHFNFITSKYIINKKEILGKKHLIKFFNLREYNLPKFYDLINLLEPQFSHQTNGRSVIHM